MSLPTLLTNPPISLSRGNALSNSCVFHRFSTEYAGFVWLPCKMKDKAILRRKDPGNIQLPRVMGRRKAHNPLGLCSGSLPCLLLPEMSGREGLVRSPKMPANNLPLPVCKAAPPIKSSLFPGLAQEQPKNYTQSWTGGKVPQMSSFGSNSKTQIWTVR